MIRAKPEFIGVLALLDFLVGNSIAQVAQSYGLGSARVAEELIRVAILRHGYAAVDITTEKPGDV